MMSFFSSAALAALPLRRFICTGGFTPPRHPGLHGLFWRRMGREQILGVDMLGVQSKTSGSAQGLTGFDVSGLIIGAEPIPGRPSAPRAPVILL